MFPKTHIIINIIISLILLLILPPLGVFIFFLSSVLIDVDHYLWYGFKKKDWNLKNAYNWFVIHGQKLKQLSFKEIKKHKQCIFFLHGIEPLVIIWGLSFIFPILIYITLGFIVHLIEDLLVERKLGTAQYKLSIVYSINDHILKRKLKFILED